MTKSPSPKRLLIYLFAFWLLTLFGIALAIGEYDIIRELQQGIEVPDSILFWNDILPLVLLLLSLVIFLLLVYSFRKILIARNMNRKSNTTEHNKGSKLRVIKGIRSYLFKGISTSLTRQSSMVLTYFILILICLFYPITRILVSSIYPAENLFHYLQQIRITLIFQLIQVFWITVLCGLVYLQFKNKKVYML